MTNAKYSEVAIDQRVNGESTVMPSYADLKKIQLLTNSFRCFTDCVFPIGARIGTIGDFNKLEGMFQSLPAGDYVGFHDPVLHNWILTKGSNRPLSNH
jgi:hypothetical protein